MAMVILYLTIPLMVLGLAMAVGPLVVALFRERRFAVEPGAARSATAGGPTAGGPAGAVRPALSDTAGAPAGAREPEEAAALVA